MSDSTYVISGTYSEILDIVKKEFITDPESENEFKERFGCTKAELLVSALTFEPKKGKTLEPFEPVNLWQLDSVSEPYQGAIGDSRFTISFKDSGLKLLDDNIVTLILAACGLKEIAGAAMVLNSLKTLIKNTHYISSEECCVYYQILRYFRHNNTSYIRDTQCMPELKVENDNYICAHLDEKWDCPFRCGERKENCSINMEQVHHILKEMCNANVLEEKNGRYSMVF